MKKSKKKKLKAKKASRKMAMAVKASRKNELKSKKKPVKKVVPAKTARKVAKKATPARVLNKVPKQSPSKKLVEMLLKEMEREAVTTRKMLQRIPEDKYDWKPHDKSMTLSRLATHIAEIPSWTSMSINTDELNFEGSKYVPKVVKNNAELLELLEKSLNEGSGSLKNTNDEVLSRTWIMRNGDTIIMKATKADMIRVAYCQIVHHRAQLGVYLRLLNVPIPGSYGPSADEPKF
jgi:uncharacterized damage-inducible protein DinB